MKKRKLEEESKNPQSSLELEKLKDDQGIWSKNSTMIQLKCLKDKLIRFKLLGPLSSTILSSVVNLADMSRLEKNSLK
jgi:hypothetical protein